MSFIKKKRYLDVLAIKFNIVISTAYIPTDDEVCWV